MPAKLTHETLVELATTARIVEAATGSLTIAACMEAWGYASTSAAAYAMNALVEAGLVRTFPRGKSGHTYRTIHSNPYFVKMLENQRVTPDEELKVRHD